MRVTLIHNEGAGDEEQPDGEKLTRLIEAAGHQVRYQAWEDETWKSALEPPADLIAVAGGDGTVGRVARALVGREVPLAPIPLGTANNIAKTLGLTDLAVADIVRGWENAGRIQFDVGVAKGPWGSRYFVEAAGVGLFARSIPEAKPQREASSAESADEKVAREVARLREQLHSCRPYRLALKLDGRDVSGEYVLFEAMNMSFVGPNLFLAPHIDPGDGRFDVVLVTSAERDALYAALAKWERGELKRADLVTRTASSIELEWAGFEVHLDDEAWPEKGDATRPPARIELTVESTALTFLAP